MNTIDEDAVFEKFVNTMKLLARTWEDRENYSIVESAITLGGAIILHGLVEKLNSDPERIHEIENSGRVLQKVTIDITKDLNNRIGLN